MSRLVGYFPLYRVFVHKSSVRVSVDYASSSLDNCPRDTSTPKGRGGGGQRPRIFRRGGGLYD